MDREDQFFRDFYDGQIIKDESDKYKMFKLLLTSLISVGAIFMYLAGFCNLAEALLIIFGMIWNFYTKLSKRIGLVLCMVVGAIYFVVSCNFKVYANAFIYIAFYIPFQLIALTRDYSEGDFVQVRKRMGDYVQIVYVVTAVCLSVTFYMFDVAIGARFEALDAVSAGCLVASAFLRNERYSDYYYFRFLGLFLSSILWINVALEYQRIDLILVIAMYASYIIFDLVTYFVQHKTYVNQYMLIVESYKQEENKKKSDEKLKVYLKNKEKVGTK